MGAFGNISAQAAQAAQQGTVDPDRPWLTMPNQEGGNGGFFGRNAQTEQRPLFSPMKTEDLVKLSAEDRNAYFADYAKYGSTMAGLNMAAMGGTQGFGGFFQASKLALGPAAQQQALNDMLFPRASGGFLPRAVQPQRTPNAPGAR
jgi:hypothetical protein